MADLRLYHNLYAHADLLPDPTLDHAVMYVSLNGANNAGNYKTKVLQVRDSSPCVLAFVSNQDPGTIVLAHGPRLFRGTPGVINAAEGLATLVGQTLMSMLMKKYNRNSYIAYTIGIVVGLSAVAMTIESVVALLG